MDYDYLSQIYDIVIKFVFNWYINSTYYFWGRNKGVPNIDIKYLKNNL